MRRAIATFIAAIAVAVPCGAPAQVAPEPSAPAAQLPEIGRVRATSSACAAMRDVVIPSYAAAMRADARFAETRKRLPQLADLLGDYYHQRAKVKSDGVFLEAAVMRLGVDSANLLNEAATIRKLLDDPRLRDTQDPSVQAERAALQQLYDVQQARAAALNELATRQSVELARDNVGMESGFLKTNKQIMAQVNPDRTGEELGRSLPSPIPAPTINPRAGMPLITGLEARDRAALDEWAAGVQSAVRQSENQASRTLLPIAQSCR
ncbi:MAG TPA: hypothetical protein VK669_08310 [Candidatus Limnocylindrales bacterium]|nr:hypothetical protein [Candidatus Limnocylindrales bacterium]